MYKPLFVLRQNCCCCCQVASVVSDSVWPHRWQPTKLPRPRDSPGKNTGVDCHFLLQCMKVKTESEVAQSCSTLSDPMDCSLPGSSVHGIFQAKVLEWGAIAFSKTELYPSNKIISTFCFQLSSQTVVANCLSSIFLDPHRTLHSSGTEPLQSEYYMGLCRRWHLPASVQHTSRTFCYAKGRIQFIFFTTSRNVMFLSSQASPTPAALSIKTACKHLVFDKVF